MQTRRHPTLWPTKQNVARRRSAIRRHKHDFPNLHKKTVFHSHARAAAAAEHSSNPRAEASSPIHNGRSRRKLQIPCLAYGDAVRFLMLFPFPGRATVTFVASSRGGSGPTHLSHARALRGAIRFGGGAREGNREIRSHLLVGAKAN